MSLLDPRDKTISLKVVYYGPGVGGKTTSLKQVHRVIDPTEQTKLVALDTDQDRTLFFDFLPIDLGLVGRFKVKIQGFTVPGQVKYNMTRRYVLTGADGIVFVADSDPARLVENVESLINLGDNLRAHGLNVNDIPLVFQFNKQDLPNALAPRELEEKLNFRKVPSFSTVAIEGDGVFDAFKAVAKLMISRVIKTYNLRPEQADEHRILADVETRLSALQAGDTAPTSVAPPATPIAAPATDVEIGTTAPLAGDDPADPLAALRASLEAPKAPMRKTPTPGGESADTEATDFFGSFGTDGPAAPATPKSAKIEMPPEEPAEAVSPIRPDRPEPRPAPEVAPAVSLPVDRVAEPAAPPPPLAAPLDVPAPAPAGSPRGPNPRAMRCLINTARDLASGASFDRVSTAVLSSVCQVFDACGASVLVRDGDTFETRMVWGLRRDPIATGGLAETLSTALDEEEVDALHLGAGAHADDLAAVRAKNDALQDAFVVGLPGPTGSHGLLAVYFDTPIDGASRRDDLDAITLLGYQLAIALAPQDARIRS